MINLKVYHGSTFIVEKPSLEVLNYRTDFGKGFFVLKFLKKKINLQDKRRMNYLKIRGY